MTLIEAVAAVLTKYMTIWPREVYERSAWDLYMIHGFQMSRALRQTAQIAATKCAYALSFFLLNCWWQFDLGLRTAGQLRTSS